MTMKNKCLTILVVFLAVGCNSQLDETITPDDTPVAEKITVAVAETAPSYTGEANDPAILLNPDDPAASLVLGSAGEGGIEVYALDGSRVGGSRTRASTFVDVRYNFPLGGDKVALIVADDAATSELLAYTWDVEAKALVERAAPIPLGMETEGLCLYRSPISNKYYAFVLGSGIVQQWELFDRGGTVAARLTRSVPLGLGAAHCAVSDRTGELFFTQETVGVAVLNAEPESEAVAEYIDLAVPHGRFVGDVKGVALFEYDGGAYLLVSDADVNRLQVYDATSRTFIGTLMINGDDDLDGVQESEGITATSIGLGEGLASGVVILADDDNEEDNNNFKIIAWSAVADLFALPASGEYDPSAAEPHEVAIVSASVETEPVRSFGDAADDPAIWVHPEDPALSIVIGTQKQRGINVYDLDGNLLHARDDGRVNNADLRYGFVLDGTPVDVVAGSNRTLRSIGIWKVDPTSRALIDVADGLIPTDMGDPYGVCMYRSPASGKFYVFVNDTDGLVKQWQLVDAGNGRIGANVVREWNLSSQTEGCVADDETGDLYIGEEDVGIWKYSAEPDGGDVRSMVDNTEDGNLTDDVEGLAIYYGRDGSGYLVASNQGADNYAVYERQGDNRFVGHFHIVADEATGIDGASETDGLDVTSANLGPTFPHGALVVQDGRNISPDENQNYKIVPWERIAEALELEVASGYDPRATDE